MWNRWKQALSNSSRDKSHLGSMQQKSCNNNRGADSSVVDAMEDNLMVAQEVAITITMKVEVVVTTITNVNIKISTTITFNRTPMVLPGTHIQIIWVIFRFMVTAQSVDCLLILGIASTKGVTIMEAQAPIIEMNVPMIAIIGTSTVQTASTTFGFTSKGLTMWCPRAT